MPRGPWAPYGEGARIQVVLLRCNGSVRHSWLGSLARADGSHVVLHAVATRRLIFPDLVIHKGDKLEVYFDRREWFYIQKYLSTDGRVRGWYCNIGTPITFEDSTIKTQDLILDLFVRPNGEYRVIDEDEFEAEIPNLPARTVRRVLAAKQKLIRIIKTRQPPFTIGSS